MAQKNFMGRIALKRDVEAIWHGVAQNFVPLDGEMILYKPDSGHNYYRYKIGDGTTTIVNLPFQFDYEKIENEFKPIQGVVISPEASNSYADAFIDTIAQDRYGKITATKKKVGNATITISPGTKLTTGGNFTTNQSTNETITLNHETTTRSNTTNSETVNYGNTFNVIDTISSDATGHITAVNTKTVTMPAAVDISGKMDKENPTGTGSFSLNRTADTTIGNFSFAEGYNTTASGSISHAEGRSTIASGEASHAEGDNTEASGLASHAEGDNTTASGDYSHAEGLVTTASGETSHAEGCGAEASGKYSHAEGNQTIANSQSQHVQGEYNVLDTENFEGRGTYAHIVGNGTSFSARSNAHTIDWSGNAWFAGDVYVDSTSGTNKDTGSKKLATEEYVGNQITANAPNLTNYKTKQTAVSSPTASGNATAFIDSISQSANGEITVTKKNVQFPDYSNTYKKIQTAVSSPTASGNTTAFIDTISQDAQGKITVTKKNVQFPDYSNTYQPKGNYKTVQTAVSDPTASGSATAFIDSISQDTNGKITVSKKNITAAALGLDRAMSFLGTTTTALTDGATTNPITINRASTTAAKGDVVIISGTDQEFIWTGSAWEEFGNASSHSIKGHTHTVTHNPAGTISKTSITPAGTVSQPTFSGSAVNSGENTGTNFSAAPGGHKHSVTAAGTVSQPTFTGTEATITISHTPAGTVSQPTFTGTAVTSGKPDTTNVTTIYSITGVGSLPSASLSAGTAPSHTYTAPSLTASIANKCMTFSWSAGSHSFSAGTYPTLTFSAGSLPTRSSAISMPNTNHTHSVTAAGTVSQPTFTGSSVSGSTKYTPAGTVSQPTFTGSAVNSGANTGTNTSVAPAKHKHSVTAAGTVSQPTFTGTAAEHSHTFTGTSATITTSGSSN